MMKRQVFVYSGERMKMPLGTAGKGLCMNGGEKDEFGNCGAHCKYGVHDS